MKTLREIADGWRAEPVEQYTDNPELAKIFRIALNACAGDLRQWLEDREHKDDLEAVENAFRKASDNSSFIFSVRQKLDEHDLPTAEHVVIINGEFHLEELLRNLHETA